MKRGFKKLSLTGTQWLIESDLYTDQLTARDIEYMRPSAGERVEINRIIMDDLVQGVLTDDTVAYSNKSSAA